MSYILRSTATHQATQLRKATTQRTSAVMIGPDRDPDRPQYHRDSSEMAVDQQYPVWAGREIVRDHSNRSLNRPRSYEPHIDCRNSPSGRHGSESNGLDCFGSHPSPGPYRSEYCMGRWLEHEDDRLLAAFANATQRQTIRECSCSSTGNHVTKYAYSSQHANDLPDLAFIGRVLDTDSLVLHEVSTTLPNETVALQEGRKEQVTRSMQRQSSTSGVSSSSHSPTHHAREATHSSPNLGVRRCGRHTNQWLFGNKGIRQTVKGMLRGDGDWKR